MKVEIVSPDKKLFESEADLVALPGITGEFAIANNHAPMISLLKAGKIRIKGNNLLVDEDNEDVFIREKDSLILPINGGAIEMKNNRLIILID